MKYEYKGEGGRTNLKWDESWENILYIEIILPSYGYSETTASNSKCDDPRE